MDKVIALDRRLVGDSGFVVRMRLGDQIDGLLWSHSGGHVRLLVCLNRTYVYMYLRFGLDDKGDVVAENPTEG